MNTHLAREGTPYMVGNKPTVADWAITPWASSAGKPFAFSGIVALHAHHHDNTLTCDGMYQVLLWSTWQNFLKWQHGWSG